MHLFSFLSILIHLFGCVGSQLRHVESLVGVPELLTAACSTRGQRQAPCIGRQILKHWASGQALGVCFLMLWKLAVQDQTSGRRFLGPHRPPAGAQRLPARPGGLLPAHRWPWALSLCVLAPSSQDTVQTGRGQLTASFTALSEEQSQSEVPRNTALV